jgi:hypothetical protein
MMRRDGHQVMIIPLITLKGLIFIQAHPYEYMKNFKSKLFPVDAIGFNAGFKYYQGVYIADLSYLTLL